MTRDQKIAWIEKAKGELRKEYHSIKRSYLIDINVSSFVDSILEVDGCDDYLKASAVNYYLNAATDNLIEHIDWSKLNVCRECQDIFEPDHSDDEFCSEDCNVAYEHYKAL